MRVIAKLGFRDSCRESFKNLNLLTLPSLYMSETIRYCRNKCTVVRGRDVHEYNTRGREILRTGQHRLQAYEALPSEVGAKLINKLPEDIRDEPSETLFERKLRRFFVQEVFYSVADFLN